MKRGFFTSISLILVLTLLVNMLPMGVFAQELRGNISTETVPDIQETVATTDTKIVAEIEEKRTEFSKEFLMNNGLHMAAVYPEAVHYEKDGAWAEIDNTLTQKADGTYTNTAGMWDVRFPQQLTGSNSVTIEKDGYTLSFAMAGELRSTGLEIAAVPEEPEVLAESVLQAVTETVSETTAEVLEETIPETTDDTVPETTEETVPETTTALPEETVPETTAETIPETTAETVPETTAAVTQETVPESTQKAEIAEPFAVSQMQFSTAQLQPMDTQALRESYEHPEMAPDKLRSRLSYEDVYQNTNIVYDLDSNQVKESIVIKSYSNTLRGYRYTLNVGQMIPVLTDDGQITLYAPDGETVVMVMPAPYLVDSADAYNSDIQVQLSGSGSRYTLTYLLPTQWLAEKDRAYPVILDPVVTAAMYRSNIRDVTIAPGVTPNNNLSKTQVGYSSGYTPAHIYLKYANLPKLTSADIIVNAAVYLTSTGEGSGGDTLVEVRKVNSTWESEDITPTTAPGYDDTVEDYAVINSATQYHWTITDLVQEWYSGENTGMLFKASNAIESAGITNYKKFYSADYSTVESRPILAIVYRNNNGLESYWDYTATSAGRAGTGYINNFTGNLVWVRNAMGFGGNLMPVNIQLIYNTNDVIAPADEEREYPGYTFDNWFGLGSGWRTNFNQLVYRSGTGDTYYVWEDADGTSHYFEKVSANTYEDEDGLELVLTDDGSGTTTYCITDKYNNCSYFNEWGYLSKIENNQDIKSSINITYQDAGSELITRITDGVGRAYTFTYNEGLLTRMSYLGADNTERDFMTFEYEHCLLIFMHDKENHVSYYDYNYNGQLCHIEDRNYMLSYSHTVTSSNKNWQPSRVSRVSMMYGGEDGGYLDIDYAHNQTTFTDHEDRVEIHQFNDFGNTVSIQDDEGRAQYSQYSLNTDEAKNNNTDATKKTNQLRLSSKLQNTVGNALRDSSFESSTNWVANNANITLSRTTDEKYMGNYSLKLENIGTATYAGYAPNFTVAAGETYTYSAYVKTDTAVAKLALHSPTVPFEILGPEIPEDTDWTRVEMSYTNTTGQAIGLCVCLYLTTAGTAYLDCVQAERAVTASRYNLVENGDFRYSSNWTANGNANGSHSIVPDSSAAAELDASVYRIVGDPTTVKSISQIVPVSGSKDDVYVLAGWAKGDSAPLTSAETDSKIRRFCLKAIFNNTDGTTTERVVSFNPDSNSINSWQYVASPVIADKAYSSILVAAVYDYNVNTVLFDGIQLYKEQFGSSYTYDDKGNVKSVTDLQGQKTEYEFDANNDLTQILQNNKAEMTYTYDNHHNVLTAKTKSGLLYTFEYDLYGNNTRVFITENGETLETKAVYSDSKNYLKSTTDTAGNITEYSYDENTGALTSVKYPKDTDATKTTYTYDDMYRMTSAACTTDTGKNLSATYSYNTNDILTAIETPSTEYTFTYDTFDLRTSVKAGLYWLAEYTYTEDANHYLSALDYGNGDSVEYTYDDKGRLVAQRYEDNNTVSYTYDNNGNLGAMTDSATGITTTYHYDLSNRLCKYTQTGEDYSRIVVYTYDSDNNLAEVSDTINGEEYTTSYAYNSDNVMTGKLHNYGFRLAETSLDEFGRPSSLYGMTLDTASPIRDYTYYDSGSTSEGRVETFRQRSSSSEEDAAYDVTYTYTYDANGNITSIDEDGYFTIYYTYDSANQLIKERHPTAGYVYTWTYDDAGNITSRTEEDRLYDTVRTVNYSYEDDGWGDRLTDYDGKRIDTDGIGNILHDGTWGYTWEHGRQLKCMSDGTTTWNYTYDANGLRIGRSNGTTTYSYLYGAEGLHSMTVGDETYIFRYDTLGNPLSMYNTATGDIYYYAVNLQGDVVGIITEDERCIVTYRYDAWGNHFQISGSGKDTIGAINPLRYRGYVYDIETGLYYLQSRYYNPELGRFISADGQISGVGGEPLGYNQFAYCFNNPVNMDDSTGNWPQWIKNAGNAIKKGVQKISEALSTFVTNVKSTVSKVDFKDIAGKATRTAKAAYTSIEASAGIGLGLYAEANMYDFAGIGFGINYNLVEVKLDDGYFSLEQTCSMGLNASVLFIDVLQDANDSMSRKLSFSSPLDDFTPDDYNLNWTIYSTGAYFIAGGSVYLGFDLVSFLQEINTIYFYN